ncbi:MAG TPA: SPOR domain-containing protein [Bacteroidaceae bacterium]|nr:SPOR domain-containing protein [Bacteroidaceae bacterium]
MKIFGSFSFVILLFCISVFIPEARAQDNPNNNIQGDSVHVEMQNILQRLAEKKEGAGQVSINQPALLDSLLVGGVMHIQSSDRLKTSGFRIQVFAGNNSRSAHELAQEYAEKVKKYNTDVQVYTLFVSPRWLCRVGDYVSFEEANMMMRQLRATGEFKEAVVVRDEVFIDQ